MDLRYISVDVETSGPTPGLYSLLAIGACVVDNPAATFYTEMQPVNDNAIAEAVAVSGLSMERLAAYGEPPAVAMQRFTDWAGAVAGTDRLVFVALNAPFDWMFVADYCERFAGRNPFGHSALDMKALFMGIARVSWTETSLHHMASHYGLTAQLPHHALEDALTQAAVFRAMLGDLDVSGEQNPGPSV